MVWQVLEESSDDDDDSIPSVSDTGEGATNAAGLMGGDSVESGVKRTKGWTLHTYAKYNAAVDSEEEEDINAGINEDAKQLVQVGSTDSDSDEDTDLNIPKTADVKETSPEEESKTVGEDGSQEKSMPPPHSAVSDPTDGAMEGSPEARLA